MRNSAEGEMRGDRKNGEWWGKEEKKLTKKKKKVKVKILSDILKIKVGPFSLLHAGQILHLFTASTFSCI